MFKNISPFGCCVSLIFIACILSSFETYASDELSKMGDVTISSEEESSKRSKRKKVRKRDQDKNIQDSVDVDKRYKVVGGVLIEVGVEVVKDIISGAVVVSDSIVVDTSKIEMEANFPIVSDSTKQQLSKKELRRISREQDTVRHNRFFRDSIPISKMCAISAVVPGFSQLYNDQAWKIPILYGTAGTAIVLGLKQNRLYSGYKRDYDAMLRRNASREELTPVQTKMIQHNTYRQILLIGALASYVYFIGDGAVNYEGETSSVKKATTLSTICPGAGQFYNKSYWKVPIVMGGFATMAYIIDFNNRGFQRFDLAYDLVTDGNDNTVDEFGGRYSDEFLNNLRKSYRRNRDLAIIITGAFYLLNIVDAHVDAHLQDYDISDDLSMDLEPILTNFYSQRSGNGNMLGMSLVITF